MFTTRIIICIWRMARQRESLTRLLISCHQYSGLYGRMKVGQIVTFLNLPQFVPDTTPTAVLDKMIAFDQGSEVSFQGVAADAS